MIVLAIEASTPSGSVALFRDEVLLSRCDVPMGVSREDTLFPAVQLVVAEAGITARDISAIVCGNGPGSFTSLRIAAAVAKGLAYATGAALYAVSSHVLAAAAHGHAGEYVVHSDALRGERYATMVSVNASGNAECVGDMVRVAASDVRQVAGTRSLLAVHHAGDHAQGQTGTHAVDTVVVPDAAALYRVAEWRDRGAVSLNEWEPQYGRLAEAQVKWEAVHQMPLPER
jgi:tRNA threonylcarbamoyladenosine biosynthesis protein TsaB